MTFRYLNLSEIGSVSLSAHAKCKEPYRFIASGSRVLYVAKKLLPFVVVT